LVVEQAAELQWRGSGCCCQLLTMLLSFTYIVCCLR
jgi:hypothetical protein